MTRREVPEVRKAVWTAAAFAGASFIENHNTVSPVWTFDAGTKPLRSMPSFHVYISVFVSKFTSHCYFYVYAQLHLRKQGSRKVEHSALSISNIDLDSIFPPFISYLCFGQRNDGVSIFYTWTKQLTLTCFNTSPFFWPVCPLKLKIKVLLYCVEETSYLYFTAKPKGFHV